MQEELVSVVVTSFNSEKTLEETLESVKNQSYQNLELIVTDDLSKDNSVQLAQNWIAKNKERFAATHVVTTSKNTGVSANCNRGMRKATGNWIKLIAGDDLLLENCIYDNMSYLHDKPHISFLLSKLKLFHTGDNLADFKDNKWSFNSEEFFNKSAKDQLNHFLSGNSVWSISLIYNREDFLKLGGFDDSKRFIEDYPFYLKMTHHGYKVYLMDKFTVGYRLQEQSLSSRGQLVKRFDFQFWRSTLKYAFLNFKVKYFLNAWWNLALLRLMKIFQKSRRIAGRIDRIRLKFGLNKY